MKKYLQFACLGGLISIFCVHIAIAQKYTYGGDYAYPPFEYLNSKGEPEGFNVDLIREMAQMYNWKIDVRLAPWPQSLQAITHDRTVDVADMFISEERGKLFDFSEPFLIIYHTFFVRYNTFTPNKIEDLIGKKVVIQKGTFVEDYLRKYYHTKIIFDTVPSEKEALEAVSKGIYDCTITGYITSMYHMRTVPLTNLISSGPPILPSPLCFAVRKGSGELLGQLNQAIYGVHTTGVYDKLYQKWFSETDSWYRNISKYLIGATILLSTLLLWIYAWVVLLKKEVRKRTFQLEDELKYRIAVQKSLEESEQMRKRTEDFSSVMVMDISLEGLIIHTSYTLCHILGYSETELKGMSLETITYKKDFQRDNLAKQTLAEKIKNSYDMEVRYISKNGSIRWMYTSCAIVMNHKNDPIGYLQFVKDITKYKDLYFRLDQMNKELFTFIYKTSHDIKGPLATIQGLINLAKMDDSTAHHDIFNMLEISVHKLDRVFFTLLEVSLIAMEKIEYTLVSIEKLMTDIIGTLQEKMPDLDNLMQHITLHNQLNDKILISDIRLLKAILYQIIDNSFRHSVKNIIHVNVSLAYDKDTDSYSIIIKDDGNGIRPEIHERIFEMFSRTDKDNGLGLGLYTAKKASERLGGRIKIESVYQTGTTVTISLPVPEYEN